MPIYTIGHSNHEFDKFLSLLNKFCIDILVDIRSIPYSKFNPQYNRENLIRNLKHTQVSYIYLGDKLGGMNKNKDSHQLKENLFSAIDELIRLSFKSNVAIMCAEENPLKCHRFFLVTKLINFLYPESKILHIRGNGDLIDNDLLLNYLRDPKRPPTQLALPLSSVSQPPEP